MKQLHLTAWTHSFSFFLFNWYIFFVLNHMIFKLKKYHRTMVGEKKCEQINQGWVFFCGLYLLLCCYRSRWDGRSTGFAWRKHLPGCCHWRWISAAGEKEILFTYLRTSTPVTVQGLNSQRLSGGKGRNSSILRFYLKEWNYLIQWPCKNKVILNISVSHFICQRITWK